MADKTGTTGADSTEDAVVLQTDGGGPVSLPGGFSLTEADFERSGDDAVLTGPDGGKVIIEDYFAGGTPPALVAGSGAQISGAMASRLAAVSSPDQAVAVGTDAETEGIGTVNTVSGKVYIVRLDGTRVEADIDTVLYAGDILETGADGAIGIVLADETTLSMGADGLMALDEMIYDPESQEGSLSMMAFKGLYTVVSGMVSKTDPDAMVINTPVGSIGIRGTQIGIELIDGETLTLVMMREADDYVGEVYLRNEGGVMVINQANQVLFSDSFTQAPVIMASVGDDTLIRMFETTLVHLPRTAGSANDYGTQATEGGGELDAFVTDSGETAEQEVLEEEGVEEELPPPPPLKTLNLPKVISINLRLLSMRWTKAAGILKSPMPWNWTWARHSRKPRGTKPSPRPRTRLKNWRKRNLQPKSLLSLSRPRKSLPHLNHPPRSPRRKSRLSWSRPRKSLP